MKEKKNSMMMLFLHIKSISKVTLFLITFSISFAALGSAERFSVWIGQSYSLTELEFEDELRDEVIDLFTERYAETILGLSYHRNNSEHYSFEVFYVGNGSFKRNFFNDTLLEDTSVNARGFRKIIFNWDKRLPSPWHDRGHGLIFNLESGLNKSKDKNAGFGGADLSIGYSFTFKNTSVDVIGDLMMKYHGVKKIKNSSNNTFKSKAYSEFGPTIGIAKEIGHFYASLQGRFTLLSGYRLTAASYDRRTEGGFSLAALSLIGLRIQNIRIELSGNLQSDIFNKERSAIDNWTDVDFEFERSQIRIDLKWDI